MSFYLSLNQPATIRNPHSSDARQEKRGEMDEGGVGVEGGSVIGFQQQPVNFHHLDLVGNLICPINRIHLPHRSITIAIHLTF